MFLSNRATKNAVCQLLLHKKQQRKKSHNGFFQGFLRAKVQVQCLVCCKEKDHAARGKSRGDAHGFIQSFEL
jgi:hypothetical protein